jgi:phosphatidylserine/phosphatidylglycerophosphate/cardiolipin synthase-like enzyme
MLSDRIGAAERIDCAFYSLGSEMVISALEQSRGEKRVLMHSGKLNASYARLAKPRGLMHNKFCILDDWVLTGSYNPSGSANTNDALLEIKGVKKAYTAEFEELWRGVFGGGAGSGLQVGPVQVLFCPEDDCAKALIREFDKAKSSIGFAYFSFTSGEVGLALVRAKNRGVRVFGVLEGAQLSKYSQAELLVYNGIEVSLDNSHMLMHHKFAVVDNKVVAIGSYNPTKNAQTRNDENLIVIQNEAAAGLFVQELNTLITGLEKR